MLHIKAGGWMWRNLSVVCLLLVVCGGMYLAVKVTENTHNVNNLAQQNRDRITDIDREARNRDSQIQLSRIFACRLFYDSIAELLKPYNPHPPTTASRLFGHRLRVLKARCPVQILRPRKKAP